MRVEENRIILSKRNLLALLHKLDMGDSARTIYKDGVFVSSEGDAEHYKDLTPGPMHPETEQYIRGFRK